MFMTAPSISPRCSVSGEVLNWAQEDIFFTLKMGIGDCNFDFLKNLSSGEKNLFIYKYLHKLARFTSLRCTNFLANPHSFYFQWSVKVTKVERWPLQNTKLTRETKSTEFRWKKRSRKPVQFIQWDFSNYQNSVLRKSRLDEQCHREWWWIQEDREYFIGRNDREWSKTPPTV